MCASITNIPYDQFLKLYTVEKAIGSGSYGQVFRIKCHETGKSYAFKKIIIEPEEDPGEVIAEILNYKTMEHELVIKLYQYYCSARKLGKVRSGLEIGLIMELGLMSLDRMISQHRQKRNQYLELRELQNFAFRFVQLFAKLQEMKISHRDIKPANFIVTQSEPLQCKLTDFGMCKTYQHNDASHHELAGSYFYMSPQLKLIFKNPKLKATYSLVKNDVYGFGVTLYELACLEPPDFSRLSFKKLKEVYHNAEVVKLIEMMMEQEEEKRPTFRMLLEMVQKIAKKDQYETAKIEVPAQEVFDKKSCRVNIEKLEELEQLDKPINKEYHPEQAQTKLQIHSLCTYKDMIFVGTDKGEMRVLHDKKIYQLPTKHFRSIEFLQVFGEELWSTGCDGRIVVWYLREIEKGIEVNEPTRTNVVDELFKHQREIERNIIKSGNLCKLYEQEEEIPNFQWGISYILKQQNLLAVGYFKGQVWLNYKGQTKIFNAHYGKITCLAHKNNKLFTSGADGMLKSIDLLTLKMDDGFFRTSSAIVGFEFFNKYDGLGGSGSYQPTKEQIQVIGMDGILQTVSVDLKPICPGKRVSSSDIFSCYFQPKRCLMVNEQGEVFQNNKIIAEVNCNGPNCIRQWGKTIVVSSFEGQIYFLGN